MTDFRRPRPSSQTPSPSCVTGRRPCTRARRPCPPSAPGCPLSVLRLRACLRPLDVLLDGLLGALRDGSAGFLQLVATAQRQEPSSCGVQDGRDQACEPQWHHEIEQDDDRRHRAADHRHAEHRRAAEHADAEPCLLTLLCHLRACQFDLLADELGDVTRQLLDQLGDGLLTLLTFTAGQVEVMTHGWAPRPRPSCRCRRTQTTGVTYHRKLDDSGTCTDARSDVRSTPSANVPERNRRSGRLLPPATAAGERSPPRLP